VLLRTRNTDSTLKRNPLVLVFDSVLEKDIERMKAVLVSMTNGLTPYKEPTEESTLFITDIFDRAMFKDELQFTTIHFLSAAYRNRWISKSDFDRIMTEVICVNIGRKYEARTIDKFVAIQNLWDTSEMESLKLDVSRYLLIAPEKLSSILRTKESLRNIINSVREAAAKNNLVANKPLLGKTVARAVVPYIAAARGLIIKDTAAPKDSVSHDFVLVDPRNGKEISVFLRVVYATLSKSKLNVSFEQLAHISQKDKPIVMTIQLSNLAEFNPVGYFLTTSDDLFLYAKNDGTGVDADLGEMVKYEYAEYHKF
jgi:hypothetical protein